MDGQAIIAVSAAVVALTQLLKWTNLVPDKWGPLAVLALAAIGVALWAYSRGGYDREQLFDLFAGWIAVATAAAGIYGFTRAAASTVTQMNAPPGGAGQNPTTKD